MCIKVWYDMARFFFLCTLLILSFAFAVDIEKMSVEEKVGQLFMAYFYGEEVNEHAERLIQEVKIGGIIYYAWANGLTSPQQVQKLSQE